MKKILSFVLVTCILVMSSFAFAVDSTSIHTQIAPLTISAEVANTINNIPVYVTYITATSEDGIESAKEESSGVLENLEKGVATASTITDEYEIVKVLEDEKSNYIDNPLFLNTFNYVQELADSGINVNYINLFLQSDLGFKNGATTYSNNDNPAYWEQNFPSLGTYKGYKFLYSESAVNLNTNEANLNNLVGSLKWDGILKKGFNAVVDYVLNGTVYSKIKAVSGTISTILGTFKPALSITYSEAGGYVRGHVSGTVYLRTILIRDDLDRISGYAYYIWGSTTRMAAKATIETKYPTSKNTSGTYEYDIKVGSTSMQNSNTPGHYGSTELYSHIIELYNNTMGYFTHDERLDVSSMVVSLLS